MTSRAGAAPHLPIWRDAQRMLVWTEQIVRAFPRYHKYTVGTRLREQAMQVCRHVLRAQASEQPERAVEVKHLHLAAEELKLLLQLGKEVQAFRSWAQFEQGVDIALSIARQAAGWRRALTGGRRVPPPARLRSSVSSYLGHFRHASFPHLVALVQLRFTSLAVTSSWRGLHPQECAHAGRTTDQIAAAPDLSLFVTQ